MPAGQDAAMARKSAGSAGTPATRALAAAGVQHVLHPYHHDPLSTSFGLEASRELGVAPERVFTALLADVDGALVVGIVPVDRQLNLKWLASALGGKRAAVPQVARAERAIGYVAGGISPIGQRSALPTVLDDSALAQPTILVSGGRRGLDIELDPRDLIGLTGDGVAAIARRD
jgi:Cys-tRNA(Pro)/Cys-tRNA(Cys) deacylase